MSDAAEAHFIAERSIWTGRVTALCGFTAEYGDYELFYLFPVGPLCPECRRIRAEH